MYIGLGRYRARKQSRSRGPLMHVTLNITSNNANKMQSLFKFQTATLLHWAVFGGHYGGARTRSLRDKEVRVLWRISRD